MLFDSLGQVAGFVLLGIFAIVFVIGFFVALKWYATGPHNDSRR